MVDALFVGPLYMIYYRVISLSLNTSLSEPLHKYAFMIEDKKKCKSHASLNHEFEDG
jgi:hypothetical protein